jgi:hypothetical protein
MGYGQYSTHGVGPRDRETLRRRGKMRRDVVHVWAHRLQESGRNSTGSLFFSGDTIYSYGRHFPIARHVTDKHGRACVLFTTRDYSVTTTGHKSAVACAIPRDVRVFHVQDADGVPGKAALDDYAKRIESALLQAARARSRVYWHLREASDLVDEANAFSLAFKLRRRFALPDDASLAALKERARLAAAKVAAATRKREREIAADRTLGLRLWAGDASLTWEPGRNYMRVRGLMVETDTRAEVRVDEVQAIAPAVVAMFAAGETYQRNGSTMMVGQYPLEEITADTVRVGCHVFSRAEVERIAALVASLPSPGATTEVQP